MPFAERGIAQPAQGKTVCVAGKLSSLYYSTRSNGVRANFALTPDFNRQNHDK
jgi:hypothetical protein